METAPVTGDREIVQSIPAAVFLRDNVVEMKGSKR
jgi:hypothetical protein